MTIEPIALACAAGLLVAGLVVREFCRRIGVRYEHRWETFSVRAADGRQLFHIRQNEIASIEPLALKDRILPMSGLRRLSRTSLAPQLVIRTTLAHARPVVVSWEGRPIAGLSPKGCKLRPGGNRTERAT